MFDEDKKQTKSLYTKTFTPETWDSLNVVIEGLGYGKTIQNILEEKYEIIVEDPQKTLEINSIRILEQRKKELLDNVKLENLRAEVIALEHKQAKTISKEQEKTNTLESENNMLKAKLTDMKSNLNTKTSEIKRLKGIGNELKSETLAYCSAIPYRKEFIESIKF